MKYVQQIWDGVYGPWWIVQTDAGTDLGMIEWNQQHREYTIRVRGGIEWTRAMMANVDERLASINAAYATKEMTGGQG